MDSFTLVMMEFMAAETNAAVEKMDKALEELARLKEAHANLITQYDRLEDWAIGQEARADALHDVIANFIERAGPGVRRDLLAEFNEVADDLDLDIDEVIDLVSDTESEDLMTMMFG